MGFRNFIHIDTPQQKISITEDVSSAKGKKFHLDTLGQVCPFPLIEVKKVIHYLNVGDELQIDFDCTQATDSIPVWAASQGHQVTDFQRVGNAKWTITIRKG